MLAARWQNGIGAASVARPSQNGSLTKQEDIVDCIVVGGGPAGLSAALMLGRAWRTVLVFDAGEKRNEASLTQHAILGADGFDRSRFLDQALQQVMAYPTVSQHNLAVCDIDVKAAEMEAARSGDLEDGKLERSHSRLANGCRITSTDRFVVHTEDGRKMLLWSKDVTLFTDGEELKATDLERELLRKHNVRVIEAVGDKAGELAGVVLQDGCFVPLRALFFNTGRIQSSMLPEKMGLPCNDRGDIVCETKGNVQAIHGLYVAGNCASAPLKLVMTAASQGAITGAKVNSELLYEELGLGEDEGEAYICSLEGSSTSANQCRVQYGKARRHRSHPTVGGAWEEYQEGRLGETGAQ